MKCKNCGNVIYSLTKDGVDILEKLGYDRVKYSGEPTKCPKCKHTL